MQMSQAALERSARTTVTVKYVDIQMKYFNLFCSRGSISKPVKNKKTYYSFHSQNIAASATFASVLHCIIYIYFF